MSLYHDLLQKVLHNIIFLPKDCIKLICLIVDNTNDPIQLIISCKEIIKQYDPLIQQFIIHYPRILHNTLDIVTYGQLTILNTMLDPVSWNNLFKTYNFNAPSRCSRPDRRITVRGKIIIQDILTISRNKIEAAVKRGPTFMMIKYGDYLHDTLILPFIDGVRTKHTKLLGYKTLKKFNITGPDGQFIRNTINSDIYKNNTMLTILTGIYSKSIIDKYILSSQSDP